MFDLKTYQAVVEGFSKGQRYRLGLGLVSGEWRRDAWTGVEVTLQSPIEFELWCCLSAGEQIVVSESRLRAAAFLGEDGENDEGSLGARTDD